MMNTDWSRLVVCLSLILFLLPFTAPHVTGRTCRGTRVVEESALLPFWKAEGED